MDKYLELINKLKGYLKKAEVEYNGVVEYIDEIEFLKDEVENIDYKIEKNKEILEKLLNYDEIKKKSKKRHIIAGSLFFAILLCFSIVFSIAFFLGVSTIAGIIVLAICTLCSLGLALNNGIKLFNENMQDINKYKKNYNIEELKEKLKELENTKQIKQSEIKEREVHIEELLETKTVLLNKINSIRNLIIKFTNKRNEVIEALVVEFEEKINERFEQEKNAEDFTKENIDKSILKKAREREI